MLKVGDRVRRMCIDLGSATDRVPRDGVVTAIRFVSEEAAKKPGFRSRGIRAGVMVVDINDDDGGEAANVLASELTHLPPATVDPFAAKMRARRS